VLSALAGWINLEKAAFLAAAALLAAGGVAFHVTPEVPRHGPALTATAPGAPPSVELEAPPPLGSFLAGSRGNPFAEPETRTVYRPRRLPRVPRPRPPRPKPAPSVVKPPPPPPRPGSDKPLVATPKPYDLPVRLVGRYEVGGRGGRTVFVVKEDGSYISAAEGEELPGLGVRIVSATKSVVIVENEKGQRFRLMDLLRARAVAGGEGGGAGGEYGPGE
jgi:hypothetical protein